MEKKKLSDTMIADKAKTPDVVVITFSYNSDFTYESVIGFAKQFPTYQSRGQGKEQKHAVVFQLVSYEIATVALKMWQLVEDWETSKLKVNKVAITKDDLVACRDRLEQNELAQNETAQNDLAQTVVSSEVATPNTTVPAATPSGAVGMVSEEARASQTQVNEVMEHTKLPQQNMVSIPTPTQPIIAPATSNPASNIAIQNTATNTPMPASMPATTQGNLAETVSLGTPENTVNQEVTPPQQNASTLPLPQSKNIDALMNPSLQAIGQTGQIGQMGQQVAAVTRPESVPPLLASDNASDNSDTVNQQNFGIQTPQASEIQMPETQIPEANGIDLTGPSAFTPTSITTPTPITTSQIAEPVTGLQTGLSAQEMPSGLTTEVGVPATDAIINPDVAPITGLITDNITDPSAMAIEGNGGMPQMQIPPIPLAEPIANNVTENLAEANQMLNIDTGLNSMNATPVKAQIASQPEMHIPSLEQSSELGLGQAPLEQPEVGQAALGHAGLQTQMPESATNLKEQLENLKAASIQNDTSTDDLIVLPEDTPSSINMDIAGSAQIPTQVTEATTGTIGSLDNLVSEVAPEVSSEAANAQTPIYPVQGNVHTPAQTQEELSIQAAEQSPAEQVIQAVSLAATPDIQSAQLSTPQVPVTPISTPEIQAAEIQAAEIQTANIQAAPISTPEVPAMAVETPEVPVATPDMPVTPSPEIQTGVVAPDSKPVDSVQTAPPMQASEVEADVILAPEPETTETTTTDEVSAPAVQTEVPAQAVATTEPVLEVQTTQVTPPTVNVQQPPVQHNNIPQPLDGIHPDAFSQPIAPSAQVASESPEVVGEQSGQAANVMGAVGMGAASMGAVGAMGAAVGAAMSGTAANGQEMGKDLMGVVGQAITTSITPLEHDQSEQTGDIVIGRYPTKMDAEDTNKDFNLAEISIGRFPNSPDKPPVESPQTNTIEEETQVLKATHREIDIGIGELPASKQTSVTQTASGYITQHPVEDDFEDGSEQLGLKTVIDDRDAKPMWRKLLGGK